MSCVHKNVKLHKHLQANNQYIRLSQKFLSFCNEIINAQHLDYFIELCTIHFVLLKQKENVQNVVLLLFPYKTKEIFARPNIMYTNQNNCFENFTCVCCVRSCYKKNT